MPKETCPGRNTCLTDLERIKDAFSMERIITSKSESMLEGYEIFRENEASLQSIGISVEKGKGRCDNCPITLYVREEQSKAWAMLNRGKGSTKLH